MKTEQRKVGDVIMELNQISNEKQKEIIVVSDTPGAPTPTLVFIFTNLCFVFWANSIGLFGEGAGLMISFMQVAFFPAYIIGAVILFKRKETPFANMFFVYSTFFALMPGVTTIASYFCEAMGFPYDMAPINISWTLAGLLLLFRLPGFNQTAWPFFVIDFFSGIGCLMFGIGGAGFLPTGWLPIAGWVFFIVGVFGLYCCVSVMLQHLGRPLLPLGKPLFKAKEQQM